MSQIFHSTNHTIPKKYHVIFWLGYFGFNVLRWGSYFGDYWYSFKSNLVEFPLHMLLVYLNIYWLMPRLVLRRKYKRYIFFLLSALLLVYCLRTGLNYLLVDKNIWPEATFPQRAFSFNHIVAVSLGELYVLALVTTIKLTVDWIREKTRVEDLRKTQKKTELDFLRSQIQPHFFFNTLNNLYALTLEKSALAPSVVLKLSDMMQYVLYDVKTPAIRLYEEINHLHNYLDLERLRFGEKVEVNTEIIGNIDNLKVPPLLFLPFVENCFKHGSKHLDKLHIDIRFEIITNEQLLFSVVNTFHTLAGETTAHGIGIQNVKRRLELLYQDRFDLNIRHDDTTHYVFLKLPIQWI